MHEHDYFTMAAQFGHTEPWIVDQAGHDDFTTTHRYYLQATSRETETDIRHYLRLLFARRPTRGLDDLIAEHDLDRLLRAEATPPPSTREAF